MNDVNQQVLEENNISIDQDKQRLYNEILRLTEEELFMRKNPDYYHDRNTTVQSGGGHKTMGFVPGKLEAIKYSYSMPLDVALKGSLARQKLFAKEGGSK